MTISSDNHELNQLLRAAGNNKKEINRLLKTVACGDRPIAAEKGEDKIQGAACQWSTIDGIKFQPCHSTVDHLIPGVYEILPCPSGIYFEKIPVQTDGLIRFPETNSDLVIDEIKKFWDREHYFDKFNLTFKRGIILWGPPGSGKSCTIQLIMSDVINRNGVVFKFTHPSLFREGIRNFRQIEPETPLVVLMEDIDSILNQYSESEVLNILDGVDQVKKVVYLATTNYPELLGERILNRPSRFDKRFKMGHPSAASRELYFRHLLSEETINECKIDLKKWVKDTSGMSVAHLRELVIAVCILGNDYEEAIDTLRSMVEDKIKSDERSSKNFGFHGSSDGDSDDGQDYRKRAK